MASSHARFVLLVTSTLVAFAAAAPQVDARPLSLTELDEFNRYVTCASACVREGDTYAAYVAYETCLIEGDPAVDGDDAECGLAPRLWEKNGIPPIDEDDYQLALLELFHTVETPESAPDPANLICYADADEEIVVPGPMCVGPVCASQELCTEEQCADDDDSLGDVTYECVGTEESGVVCWYPIDIRPAYCTVAFCEGFDADSCDDDLPVASVDDGGEELTPAGNQLPDWLDNYFADADGDGAPDSNVPLSVCGGVAACDLDHACQYDPELGRGTCEARACLCAPADADCTTTCTAFHLEQVAHDDQEVIFHVWYDHTPTPARTLDLYLEYDQAAMTLHDARRLPSLVLNGKKLATTHLSDGTLRLSVLDDDGTHAIPTGPIVELVFALHSQASTTLGFAKTDALQYKAVAPYKATRLMTSSPTTGAGARPFMWPARRTQGPACDSTTASSPSRSR